MNLLDKMYDSGQIYYLHNFQDTPKAQQKNRYCIILDVIRNGTALLLHKTTTQVYGFLSGSLKEGGNIVNDYTDAFFIPKNKAIGKEKGFSFSRDSYIYVGTWRVSEIHLDEFNKFEKDYLDTMDDDLLNDLVYFIYQSKHVRHRIRDLLGNTLEKLNE